MPRVPTIALAASRARRGPAPLRPAEYRGRARSSTPTPTPSRAWRSEAPITPEPLAHAADLHHRGRRHDLEDRQEFDVTPEDLLAANPQVKNPNRIKVGDELTIPAPEVAPTEDVGTERRGVAKPLTASALASRSRQICSAGQRRAQAWATSSQ